MCVSVYFSNQHCTLASIQEPGKSSFYIFTTSIYLLTHSFVSQHGEDCETTGVMTCSPQLQHLCICSFTLSTCSVAGAARPTPDSLNYTHSTQERSIIQQLVLIGRCSFNLIRKTSRYNKWLTDI